MVPAVICAVCLSPDTSAARMRDEAGPYLTQAPEISPCTAYLLVDLLTRPSARIQRLRGARTSSGSCHHKPGRARYVRPHARATLFFSTVDTRAPGSSSAWRPGIGLQQWILSARGNSLSRGPAPSEPARARQIKTVRLLVSHFVRFAILPPH